MLASNKDIRTYQLVHHWFDPLDNRTLYANRYARDIATNIVQGCFGTRRPVIGSKHGESHSIASRYGWNLACIVGPFCRRAVTTNSISSRWLALNMCCNICQPRFLELTFNWCVHCKRTNENENENPPRVWSPSLFHIKTRLIHAHETSYNGGP